MTEKEVDFLFACISKMATDAVGYDDADKFLDQVALALHLLGDPDDGA